MKMQPWLCAGVTALFLLTGAANGEPPRVVRASPDHGDLGVDAGVTEIRVEFDQDMNHGGQSICGGGPTFPKLTGKPRWESARVMIVPVALEAGRSYSFSINCPAARNFRSAAGEAADPYPIQFSTARDGEKPLAISEDEAKAMTADLLRLVKTRYSYRDRLGVDWDAEFRKHETEMHASRTPGAFARAARHVLHATSDPHVHLRVGDVAMGIDPPSPKRNVHLGVVERMFPRLERLSAEIRLVELEGGVMYAWIGSWDKSVEGDVAALKKRLRERVKDALRRPLECVILDVRANGGGDELVARALASMFVPEARVYSRNKNVLADGSGGWTATFDRVIEPAGDDERISCRAIVLMGGQCMSSNESFLLMMKHGAGATLVGERSRGSSGNPRAHELGRHVQVVLPSWKDLMPDGTEVEGRGIEPDVSVPWSPSGTEARDPVIDEAMKLARKGSGSPPK